MTNDQMMLAFMAIALTVSFALLFFTSPAFRRKAKPSPKRAATTITAEWMESVQRELGEAIETAQAPIPMILHCPECHHQHIDAPNPARGWTDPPHRKHQCQWCGHLWRPANVNTTGVAELPL